MSTTKLQAQQGNPQAIATLLEQVLLPQPIDIKVVSKNNCIILRLECLDKLPQDQTVKLIERFFKKLQSKNIDQVKIKVFLIGTPNIDWEILINITPIDGALNDVLSQKEIPIVQIEEISKSVEVPPQDNKLLPYYQQLNLEPGATLEQVQKSYFQIKSQINPKGNAQKIIAIREAYQAIKEQLQLEVMIASQTEITKPIDPLNELTQLLKKNGIDAKISVVQDKLQIYLEAKSFPQPNLVVKKINRLFETINLANLHLEIVAQILIFGLNNQEKIIWRKSFNCQKPLTKKEQMEALIKVIENGAIFPILSILAIVMNIIPIVNFLLRGISIWFHEFGHAIIAWLGGYKAIPLPFGWTNVENEKSLFVYFGVLILLGLLFWKSWQEKKIWSMILAVSLALIQFWMTWLISETTFYTLLFFGGIGGEFYLCTLLMVSFFFTLPEYFNWEFYRFPAVVCAAFTFWDNLWFWWQIDQGNASIPWGSLWGGADDSGGDMDQLVQFGWSDKQIIETYNFLGNLCFIIILCTYFYFLFKNNQSFFRNLIEKK